MVSLISEIRLIFAVFYSFCKLCLKEKNIRFDQDFTVLISGIKNEFQISKSNNL